MKFNAWYDTEEDWDYASVQVKEADATEWTAIQGNITTAENPNEQNPGNGITGRSDGWVPATFDLTAYAGKKIDLKFNYWTDPFVAQRNPLFDDSANYSNTGLVDAGRKVPNYGLKFRVVGESPDGTVGKVLIFK